MSLTEDSLVLSDIYLRLREVMDLLYDFEVNPVLAGLMLNRIVCTGGDYLISCPIL